MNYDEAEIFFKQIYDNKDVNTDINSLLSAIDVFRDIIKQTDPNENEKTQELWYRIYYLTGLILPNHVYHNKNQNKAGSIELQLTIIRNMEEIIDSDNSSIDETQKIFKLYFDLCINTANELLLERCDLMEAVKISDKLILYIKKFKNTGINDDMKNELYKLSEKYIDYNVSNKIEKNYARLDRERARFHFEKICNLLSKLSNYKKNYTFLGYFNAAKQRKREGDLEQSLQYISYAIWVDPTNAEALKFRGYIYFEISNFKNSESDFINAMSINSLDYETYYVLGIIYNVMKEYDKAVDRLSKFLERYPDDVQGNNAISISYRNIGNTDKVLFCLNRALRNKPDYAMALSNRAQIYLRQNRPQEAIKDCKTIIEKNKNDDIAYDTLGLAYAMAGDYKAAHLSFSRALEVNINNYCAKEHINILEAEGVDCFKCINPKDDIVTKYDKSKKTDAQEIIKFNVDFSIRDLLKKEINAIKTKISPDTSPYAIVSACTLIDNEKDNEAIEILQDIEKETGYRPDVCFHLGLAYLKRRSRYSEKKFDENEIKEIISNKDTESAISYFDTVIDNEKEKDEDNYYLINAYYYRSLAHYIKGENFYFAKKDIENYQKLREITNKKIKKDTNNNDFIENDPLNLTAMGLLGKAYLKQGNYEEAKNILDNIIYLYNFYNNSFNDILKETTNINKIELIKYYLKRNNITDELFVLYLLLRSKANYSLGDIKNIKSAKSDCEEALRICNDNDFAKRLLDCYNKNGFANGIIMEMLDNDSDKKKNSSLDIEYTHGMENAKSGKFEDAINNFTNIICNNPEYADIYRLRAFAYLGNKNKESAFAGFKEANQINKSDHLSRRWITKIQLNEAIPDIAELFKNDKV